MEDDIFLYVAAAFIIHLDSQAGVAEAISFQPHCGLSKMVKTPWQIYITHTVMYMSRGLLILAYVKLVYHFN
jgi:hypothetical protein